MPKNGLTLIELLVTITIIGVLTGFGLASYNSFNKRQVVKGAALNFKNDLRQAQNKALAGEKDCLSGSLDGWYVAFTANNYSFYGHCGGTGGSNFNQTTVNLPDSVSFSPVPSSPILFKVLGQGVNAGQTICLVGFNQKYKISVTVSGEIQDGGFISVCP